MLDFVRTDVGESALRHSTQIGSIAKILEDHGLLRDSTCFIEFGSGRGMYIIDKNVGVFSFALDLH